MDLIKYCGVDGGNFGNDFNLQVWERLFTNLNELSGCAQLYGVDTLLIGANTGAVFKGVVGTRRGRCEKIRLMPAAHDWHMRTANKAVFSAVPTQPAAETPLSAILPTQVLTALPHAMGEYPQLDTTNSVETRSASLPSQPQPQKGSVPRHANRNVNLSMSSGH